VLLNHSKTIVDCTALSRRNFLQLGWNPTRYSFTEVICESCELCSLLLQSLTKAVLFRKKNFLERNPSVQEAYDNHKKLLSKKFDSFDVVSEALLGSLLEVHLWLLVAFSYLIQDGTCHSHPARNAESIWCYGRHVLWNIAGGQQKYSNFIVKFYLK